MTIGKGTPAPLLEGSPLDILVSETGKSIFKIVKEYGMIDVAQITSLRKRNNDDSMLLKELKMFGFEIHYNGKLVESFKSKVREIHNITYLANDLGVKPQLIHYWLRADSMPFWAIVHAGFDVVYDGYSFKDEIILEKFDKIRFESDFSFMKGLWVYGYLIDSEHKIVALPDGGRGRYMFDSVERYEWTIEDLDKQVRERFNDL